MTRMVDRLASMANILCKCGCGEIVTPGHTFRKGHWRRWKDQSGPNNHMWKTDLTTDSLHVWIRKNYKKTGRCEWCGREAWTDWANMSGRYLRERSDFAELCRSCHKTYDLSRPGRLCKNRRHVLVNGYEDVDNRGVRRCTKCYAEMLQKRKDERKIRAALRD